MLSFGDRATTIGLLAGTLVLALVTGVLMVMASGLGRGGSSANVYILAAVASGAGVLAAVTLVMSAIMGRHYTGGAVLTAGVILGVVGFGINGILCIISIVFSNFARGF